MMFGIYILTRSLLGLHERAAASSPRNPSRNLFRADIRKQLPQFIHGYAMAALGGFENPYDSPGFEHPKRAAATDGLVSLSMSWTAYPIVAMSNIS